jgi:cytochrome b561
LTDIAAAAARYDPVALTLHWLVAALVVTVVVLGWLIGDAPRGSDQRDLFLLLHRSIGLTILAAIAIRLLWRWRHPPPPLPSDLALIQAALAHLNHAALYAIFIAMPVAGYLNAAAAGHAVSFFGLFAIPPLLPSDPRLSQIAIAVHLVGQYFVYLFVAAHVVAALYHGLVRRDGVLQRMLPPALARLSLRPPRRG